MFVIKEKHYVKFFCMQLLSYFQANDPSFQVLSKSVTNQNLWYYSKVYYLIPP
jgi:hypothetical protein